MFDSTYTTAVQAWQAEDQLWSEGTHPIQIDSPDITADYPTYTRFFGSFEDIRPDYHRPQFTEEPTWYQVYETTTEGTPATPAFETLEELTEHLVQHEGVSQEAALAFVADGYAFSFAQYKGELLSDYSTAIVTTD